MKRKEKTLDCGSCFLYFPRVLKCSSCFISVEYTAEGSSCVKRWKQNGYILTITSDLILLCFYLMQCLLITMRLFYLNTFYQEKKATNCPHAASGFLFEKSTPLLTKSSKTFTWSLLPMNTLAIKLMLNHNNSWSSRRNLFTSN